MLGTYYIIATPHFLCLIGLSNLVCLMLNLSLFIAILLMVCDEFVISVLIILFLTRVIDLIDLKLLSNNTEYNNEL